MPFQTAIADDQAYGITGEMAFDGPKRAEALNVNSNAGVPNLIGGAFTHTTGVDGECAPGALGGGAFAGFLLNPKVHATGNSLETITALPDNTSAELMTMGIIIVDLTIIGTGAIGEPLFYVDTTGAIGSGTAAAGQTQIANAKISHRNISAPGQAVVTLTEAE
tara:strand:+ start:2109 stop:2600 length:492 start_codon:yes stop_codon:yes gene_type:complete